MKKTIVYYYSKSGNNKFIAGKIAKELNCDIEPLRPIPGAFLLLLLMSPLKIASGIKKLEHDPVDYDQVIICSPIWMGQLVSPIRGFIKKYNDKIQKLIYITVCGSGDDQKDDKFGYESVFSQARDLADGKLELTQALSIKLLTNKGKPLSDEELRSVKITDETFRGEIKKRFDGFIEKIKSL